MSNLDTVHEQVFYLLKNFPKTRDSDKRLIGGVYHLFYEVDTNTETFAEVIDRPGLPSFESIRRCRQKIQAGYPELRGVKDKERLERQGEYVAYAMGETI